MTPTPLQPSAARPPRPDLRDSARPRCGRTGLRACRTPGGRLETEGPEGPGPRRRRRPGLHGALGLVLLLAACSESSATTAATAGSAGDRATTGEAADAGRDAPTSGPQLEREVGDLVAAFTPPAETATTSVQDDWLRRRRATLTRMRSMPRELGEAALAAYRERRDDPVPVRSGLLEAASIAAPEATRPELVRLVTEYGDDLGLRTDACRLLGESSPDRAIEVFPKILLDPQRSSTAPPDEAMLAGWLRACELSGASPLPALARLATDLQRDQATRHLAVRALADYPSKVTLSALEEVLRESTGNAYLRRLAAQTMIEVGEFETVCPILHDTFEHEADTNFQLFLEDVIETYCP
jgi:hypothetical protein